MYKIPANTLFVGKNIVFVPEWHSTNSLAMELGQRANGTEGTVIITDNQYSGRGQRGNRWISEPGKNFTLSIILKPNLPPHHQFLLTQVIALGVADYVKTQVQSDLVKIKWPNDILVAGQKVCGILIESSLSGSSVQFIVAGIGLNMNQQSFENSLATSLRCVSGNSYDLQKELPGLLQAVEIRYLQLRDGKINRLKSDYKDNLYRLGEWHDFKTSQGTFHGRIEGVDEAGKLVVQSDAGTHPFDLKEINFADRSI